MTLAHFNSIFSEKFRLFSILRLTFGILSKALFVDFHPQFVSLVHLKLLSLETTDIIDKDVHFRRRRAVRSSNRRQSRDRGNGVLPHQNQSNQLSSGFRPEPEITAPQQDGSWGPWVPWPSANPGVGPRHVPPRPRVWSRTPYERGSQHGYHRIPR